jgi:alkanesulfonate monooxygenase SsuD/methylene tetrahydromethanopterin reductase-like flavin-dependent oxidoreductase (luciferase family)
MRSLSILDFAVVPEGGTPANALRNTLDLAQHAERWGYRHFWLAEYHNMVGIASAGDGDCYLLCRGGHTRLSTTRNGRIKRIY